MSRELEMTNSGIIENYRGLWKTEDHVEAYFLICFNVLVISIIIEMEQR